MTTNARSRAATIALWVLAAVVAVLFGMAGVSKLAGEPAQVDLFEAIGVGQWLRYVVGALEVAGAIGVLIPRLRALAAVGLTLVMLGAVIINLGLLGYNPIVAAGFGVLAALLAVLRRRELGRHVAAPSVS